MSKVQCFKLVSGADIIAKVEEVPSIIGAPQKPTSGDVVLEKAIYVAARPAPNGDMTVSFIPMAPLSDNVGPIDFTLPASAVLFPYNPNPQLEDMYIQHTSGLLMARR